MKFCRQCEFITSNDEIEVCPSCGGTVFVNVPSIPTISANISGRDLSAPTDEEIPFDEQVEVQPARQGASITEPTDIYGSVDFNRYITRTTPFTYWKEPTIHYLFGDFVQWLCELENNGFDDSIGMVIGRLWKRFKEKQEKELEKASE